MAHVTADRVRDTSTSTGTGTIVVSGTAPTAFRTFSAVCSTSDTFYYAIQHQTAAEWEVGLGTYSALNTITRTTVYASSAGGSAVSFSAGTKDVFITLAAARTVQLDNNGAIAGITDAGDLTFTGTGRRITGDFSNATLSNRLMFQNSVTNSGTSVGIIANGTGTSGAVNVFASSDPANASYLQIRAGTDLGIAIINSNITGTGTYLPMTFNTGGSERMRIDTSGNVGVGTSSPANKLQVSYTSTAPSLSSDSGAGLSLLGSSTLRVNIGSDPSSPFGGWIQSSNGSGSAFPLNLNPLGGNVGIGTSSPVAKLNVKALDAQNSAMIAGTTTGARFSTDASGIYVDGTDPTGASSYQPLFVGGSIWGVRISGTEKMRIDSSGNLLVGSTVTRNRLTVASSAAAPAPTLGTASGTAYFSNSDNAYGMMFGTSGGGQGWIQQQRVDGTATAYDLWLQPSGGNVGIGTSSAAEKLVVNGNTSSDVYKLRSNTSAPASTDSFIFRPADNTLGFGTGSTERARIDSSGNLLVGKTASNGTTNGIELRANGSILSTRPETTNAASTMNVYSSGASAFRFYVEMDGKVNATNTTIAAISDQRLKENVRDIDVGLAAIMALKPRQFDWKTGKGKNIKNDRGWIAQEFEQVFPEMVGTWKDPSPDGEEPYKSVCADLIPVLVKAIQELKAEIDALKGAK